MLKFGPLFSTGWVAVKQTDPDAVRIFQRHYSCTKGHAHLTLGIAGPGETLTLLNHESQALFVWRRIQAGEGKRLKYRGLHCAVFRNEGVRRSSDLIIEAEASAVSKWGPVPAITFIDAAAIRSTNPGCCFLKAGWRRDGYTKVNHLLILRKELTGGQHKATV